MANPDGKLTLTYNDGTTEDILFADIKFWSVRDWGILIRFPGSTVRGVVWTSIRSYVLTTNTKAFIQSAENKELANQVYDDTCDSCNYRSDSIIRVDRKGN